MASIDPQPSTLNPQPGQRVALIDYGSGNLRSVSKALQREGADVRLASSAAEIADAEALVLPGVGAFGDCVQNLRSRGLWDPIGEWLANDRPFLGICVGYQMLFESSEEAPGERGFGFFKGHVKRFDAPGLKVPQIGWNTLEFSDASHTLWQGLPRHPHVYFVHSFFPVPEDESIVTSRTTYGTSFAASASRGRVSAVQFHPEKSQETGLTILRNFVQSIQGVPTNFLLNSMSSRDPVEIASDVARNATGSLDFARDDTLSTRPLLDLHPHASPSRD